MPESNSTSMTHECVERTFSYETAFVHANDKYRYEHFKRKMSCCYPYFLNKSIAIVVSGKMLLWSYWLSRPKDSPVRNTRNWMAMCDHLWMYWLSGRDTVRPVYLNCTFRCACAIRRVCINFSYICWTLIGFLARTPTHTFSQRASAAPVRVPRFL